MSTDSPRAATEAELLRIAEFNRTTAEYPDNATLNDLIDAQFARHPSRTAVVCDYDQTLGTPALTYSQLDERVNQLAQRLRAEGVARGQIVAIMAQRSFAMIIGIFAIVRAGAAYLPLSPDNPPERIDYMLKDAGVAVLLVHDRTAAKV